MANIGLSPFGTRKRRLYANVQSVWTKKKIEIVSVRLHLACLAFHFLFTFVPIFIQHVYKIFLNGILICGNILRFSFAEDSIMRRWMAISVISIWFLLQPLSCLRQTGTLPNCQRNALTLPNFLPYLWHKLADRDIGNLLRSFRFVVSLCMDQIWPFKFLNIQM